MTTLTPPPQRVPPDLTGTPGRKEFFTRLKNSLYYLFEDHRRLNTALLNALQPVSGFVPTRDSTTELTFSSGSVVVSSGIYTRSSSIQKILGTTWDEGNAAGGQFSGATIGATDDYYAIAISKDSDPQTVDIGFDDNSSGTNAPSGWTVLREVFRGMTNSSSQFDDLTAEETAGGGVVVKYAAPTQAEFQDTNPGANTTQTKTLAYVPPSTRFGIVFSLIDTSPTAVTYFYARETWQTAASAGFSNHMLNTRTAGNTADSGEFELSTDSSRQIAYVLNNSDADVTISGFIRYYILERR